MCMLLLLGLLLVPIQGTRSACPVAHRRSHGSLVDMVMVVVHLGRQVIPGGTVSPTVVTALTIMSTRRVQGRAYGRKGVKLRVIRALLGFQLFRKNIGNAIWFLCHHV